MFISMKANRYTQGPVREVLPEVQVSEYKGVEVVFEEPQVTDEDVEKRLEELRESKATYVNEDARPLAAGDYAVVALESRERRSPSTQTKCRF